MTIGVCNLSPTTLYHSTDRPKKSVRVYIRKKKLWKNKKLDSMTNIKKLGGVHFEVTKELKSAWKFCAET